MTCLRAQMARLRVGRGDDSTQYPILVVPSAWPNGQVLPYAQSVHAPLGHTVSVLGWSKSHDLWLPNPDAFADYQTGELA